MQKLNYEFDKFINDDFFDNKNKILRLRINFQNALNNGHSNIDNNAEFYAPGINSSIISTRFEIRSKYLLLELEPYSLVQNHLFKPADVFGTYAYTNNNSNISSFLI